MVKLHNVPGLEVQILVDGRPLQEHPWRKDIYAPNPKEAVVHIVAEPGKEFGIRLKLTEGLKYKHDDLSVDVKMDKSKVYQHLIDNWKFTRRPKSREGGSKRAKKVKNYEATFEKTTINATHAEAGKAQKYKFGTLTDGWLPPLRSGDVAEFGNRSPRYKL